MGIMFLSKTMGANPLHRPIFLFSDTGEFLNDGDKPWRISVTIEAMVSEVLLQQPHPLCVILGSRLYKPTAEQGM